MITVNDNSLQFINKEGIRNMVDFHYEWFVEAEKNKERFIRVDFPLPLLIQKYMYDDSFIAGYLSLAMASYGTSEDEVCCHMVRVGIASSFNQYQHQRYNNHPPGVLIITHKFSNGKTYLDDPRVINYYKSLGITGVEKAPSYCGGEL